MIYDYDMISLINFKEFLLILTYYLKYKIQILNQNVISNKRPSIIILKVINNDKVIHTRSLMIIVRDINQKHTEKYQKHRYNK